MKAVHTYTDLLKEDYNFWSNNLIYGWNEKKWTIPKLPKLEKRTLLIRSKHPYLTNKEINQIVTEINIILRNLKKSN